MSQFHNDHLAWHHFIDLGKEWLVSLDVSRTSHKVIYSKYNSDLQLCQSDLTDASYTNNSLAVKKLKTYLQPSASLHGSSDVVCRFVHPESRIAFASNMVTSEKSLVVFSA